MTRMLVCGLVLVTACHRGGTADPGANAAPVVRSGPVVNDYAPDTLRGVVVLEGSVPDVTVTLRTASGRVEIHSSPRELLMASGLEVRLKGSRREGGRFAALDFEVRAVRDREATDGRLQFTSGIYELIASGGRRVPLRDVPPTFAGLVGHRLWIVLNAAGGLAEYGVLDR